MSEHIAIYLPLLSGGGAERAMVVLANGFTARGHKVDLVVARAEGPYLKDLNPGLRVVDLNSRRSPIVPLSLAALTGYLKRERPRVLLSTLTYTSVVAVVARALAGVDTRLYVSEQNALSSSVQNAVGWSERWKPHFLRWSYPRVDGLVAVSSGVADDISEVLGYERDRIRVIHNPIETAKLLALADERVEHPWFAPGEPPVVLGVGRLTSQKDFPTLIRAFAQLRSGREARLMILGEGELRGELESLVESLGLSAEVALPGFVDNPFAYMRAAALFVLSSRWEGLANVIIEALACGTPVVSTDCPYGPAEILDHGRWGRLVQVGDYRGMAEAMIESLSDPDPSRGSVRARDFDADLIVDEYLDLLGLRVAESARSRP